MTAEFKLTRIARALPVCLMLMAVAGCKKDTNADDANKPVMAVEAVSPQTSAWPEVIEASGNVAAWQEAVIGAEVGGARLLDVKVNVGDVVTKGQELARLDGDLLQATLAQQQAAVVEAQANLEKAQADAKRADTLDTTGSISQQDLQQYRTTAATAAAQLKVAKAQADLAALNVKYTRVLAPDNGIISSRTATVGTVVSAGSELFRMIREQRLEWRAEVPAQQMAKIRPGMSVTISRPDGQTVEGSVRKVAPTVDTTTRNGIVYVDLPGDSGLTAGQFVGGRLQVGSATAMSLPESAIVLRDGHDYVMTIDAQHLVHQLKIETGRRQDKRIEVEGTLSAQTQVVASGGAFLGEGDLVSIDNGQHAASASAPAAAAGTENKVQ